MGVEGLWGIMAQAITVAHQKNTLSMVHPWEQDMDTEIDGLRTDLKHAIRAPVIKMNNAKHALAELKLAQREVVEVVDNYYAEGNNRREEEASNAVLGNCNNKDNKDTEAKEEERRNNAWDDII